MRLTKRSAALIATGIAGVMALAACSGGSSGSGSSSSSSGGGAPTGRVVYGESTDWPENLMPLISAGNATSTANIEVGVFPEVYLIQPDTSLKVNTDLLASDPTSTTSGGAQTITYKLNPKANWSDGKPITADDFKYTWNIQKSTTACPALLSSTGYELITSVDGTDNGKTVTVKLKQPFADWKSLFSGNSNPLFPAHIMDKGSDAANCQYITTGWATADGFPSDISGGPWQVQKKNIDNGKQIIVETPNPNYYGAKPKVAQLVIQEIGNDPTTAVQGLQSGELNMIYPQPQLDLVGQIKGLAPNISSKVSFGLSFEHLDFNTTYGPLQDVKVRQAFAMALDRQTIVDQTVGQFSSDAKVLDNRIWLNTQPQYQDTAPAQYKKQNTAQAKSLLESDGYTLGSDGIYAKGGQRLSFKIDTTVNNPLRQQTIQVMIPMLKAAGIEAAFNANPDIFKGPDKPTSLAAGGFQIALFAWVGNPFISSQPPIYESPKAAGGTQQNYSRAGNDQIDALLNSWQTETDSKKVADTGNQIDKLLWDQMATLPLYQKPTFIAYSSTVQGAQDNPTQQGPLWNANVWSVKQ